MRPNIISLHYKESRRQWEPRGYAQNVHLIVDYDNRVYRYLVNFMIPNMDINNKIEVKRKSDIEDYVEYLKEAGFTETTEVILW